MKLKLSARIAFTSITRSDLVGHCIEHGNSFIRMVQKLSDFCQTSGRLVFAHRIHFACRMRRNIDRNPKSLCCAFQVFPNGLPCPVPPLVKAVLKHEKSACLRLQIVPQLQRQPHTAAFACLLLLDRETVTPQQFRPKLQHVANPQTGSQARFNRKAIFRR